MPVIEVTELRKSYAGRPAVDGVSFAVEEGEIFGVLGPNGAGKTTTEQPAGYFLALLLATAVALALGAVVSALSRTTKIAGAIGSAVFFPAMFCAGVWLPVRAMPDTLARIVGYTPFGAAAQALDQAAAGHWNGWTRLAVLVAWTALLTGVAARRFRWE